MTKVHLLGIAKVRRSLMIPILAYTFLNAARHADELGTPGMAAAYVLFDAALWIGVAFLIFAVIERRQRSGPQPRFAAMTAATVGIAALATAVITVRALFESIVLQRPFVSQWLLYVPGSFFNATSYIAIVTGIGYAVYSWAVEDRRLAEAAELDAAVARAELKAASGHLQPELLDVALAHLSTLMTTNAAGAQHLISDLGALLHDSLAHPQSELVPLGEELDHVERFVDFQRAVGACSVHLSIVADAEVRSRRIPHLALHTLVQNAIAQSRHRRIDVSIHAATTEGVVRMTVSERRDCVSPTVGEWRVELELPAT